LQDTPEIGYRPQAEPMFPPEVPVIEVELNGKSTLARTLSYQVTVLSWGV
jgi:hypothetical protein